MENTKPKMYKNDADLLEPAEGGYMHFGALRIFATPVKLEAGAAGYSVPRATDFDGNPKMFKGKVKVAKSRTTHIVFTLTKRDREGVEFTMNKQVLNNDKPYKKDILPAMKAVIPSLHVNDDVPMFIQAEEVATGRTYTDSEGNEKDDTLWKPVRYFASEAEMKVAADEYFAQFADDENAAPAVAVPPGYQEAGWLAIRGNVKSDKDAIGVEATANKWNIPADWLTANLG